MREINKSTSFNKCALCYENDDLKLSHVVPKFVFNYIKKTSITGKFRDPTNFKKRVQDGPKYRLLCGECEQLFSESEKYFAEKIFYPYVKGEQVSLHYVSNLKYFIESVHWRFLLTQMNSFKGEELQILKDTEISVRSTLRFQKMKEKVLVLLQLDYPKYPRWASHSLYCLDEDIISLANNEMYSLKRMVTCDLFFYKKQLFIYSYYCGLIMCSVYRCRLIDYLNLRGFLIREKGEFKLRSVGLDNIVVTHLLTIKHRMISESLNNISEEDRKKFISSIERSAKARELN